MLGNTRWVQCIRVEIPVVRPQRGAGRSADLQEIDQFGQEFPNHTCYEPLPREDAGRDHSIPIRSSALPGRLIIVCGTTFDEHVPDIGHDFPYAF